VLFACSYDQVEAQKIIDSTKECNKCLDDGWNVCKSRLKENTAFCCDLQEDYSDDCTTDVDNFNSINFSLCSNEVPKPTLQKFACPVSKKACSICDDEDDCLSNNNTIVLHPWTNNYTAISLSRREFSNGESCYYRVYADQAALAANDTYNFQIDANITVLDGVWAFLTNGTNIFRTTNDTEVHADSLKRNFTYNATGFNNLWLHFTADPSFEGRNEFLVLLGLRELEKEEEDTTTTTTDDDDDDDDIEFDVLTIPKKKSLTLNEEIVINGIFIAVILYCCKSAFCDDSWMPPRLQDGSFANSKKAEVEMKEPESSEDDDDTDQDVSADNTKIEEKGNNRIHSIKEELEVL